MKTITNHWDKFYKVGHLLKPSSFSKFVLQYTKKNKTLIDVGCGNGRDTLFFIKNKIRASGADNSKVAISSNQEISQKSFFKINICQNKINIKKKFDYIYARFFIHAINLNDEKKLFKNLRTISKKNSLIFLEFRTTSDPLMNKGKKISKYERIYGHYRRFIDVKKFKERLMKNKFIIKSCKESSSFAKFDKEKPSVCRMILTFDKLKKFDTFIS